jgi:hypothetical protein
MSLTAFILHLRPDESLTIHTELDVIRYELSVGVGTRRPQRIVGMVQVDTVKTTHHDVLSEALHRELDTARGKQRSKRIW